MGIGTQGDEQYSPKMVLNPIEENLLNAQILDRILYFILFTEPTNAPSLQDNYALPHWLLKHSDAGPQATNTILLLLFLFQLS